MKKQRYAKLLFILTLLALFFPLREARAESQNSDYKGINDPFGDPSNYEFAEDEKEDKEFFHLGRFFMLGFDLGAGLFTGGLGASNDPAMYVGAKIIYFFDRSLAFEAAVHYASHTDFIQGAAGSGSVVLDTTLVPLTGGFRFYFDTRDAPRALAVANPYLAFGAGVYLRSSSTVQTNGGLTLAEPDPSNANFGIYAGGGMEFNIYRKHLYLGLDLRYHMVFFIDESNTLQGALQPGDRAGDYFTPAITFTYNF